MMGLVPNCCPVAVLDPQPFLTAMLSLQFETLAGFSAVIDRLGEFMEVLDEAVPIASSSEAANQEHAQPLLASGSSIQLEDEWHEGTAWVIATSFITCRLSTFIDARHRPPSRGNQQQEMTVSVLH